ncbi:MAG: YqcI/YcgG family protein [Oligoflexus sp.]|nr:YqcI/YcgG family protein [Oligoflexus sp.]
MQGNAAANNLNPKLCPYKGSYPSKLSDLEAKNIIHDYVANIGFPCVGAKTALAKDQIEICVADSIFSSHNDDDILKGLYRFIAEYQKDKAIFRSFIVVFCDELDINDEDFESALWTRLQSLNDKDIFPWDASVSQNPEDKTFSFSAGNKAFYIVGMHPGSSRKARRFPLPALVFNMHEQFEQLRASGQYQKMRSLIRRRDEAFSGSSNPMLEDFGDNSEAVQYSGRQISGEWKCPFHNKGIN